MSLSFIHNIYEILLDLKIFKISYFKISIILKLLYSNHFRCACKCRRIIQLSMLSNVAEPFNYLVINSGALHKIR